MLICFKTIFSKMELVGRQISLRVSKKNLNDLKFHQILSFRWYCKILTSKKSTDHQNAGFVSKLHPLVPECPKNIKSLFNRKQLTFYVAYSDKTIYLNLVHHHDPNGSTKGKLSDRNQETNICLYLYPGTCTQVHVWLNVLLFIPLLYYMLHFCCLFFFSM